MNCPVCPQTDLVMSDRQGIEIDYCPKCRGVWLDRGELDKIIERSTDSQSRPAQTPIAHQQPVQHPSMHDSDYGKYQYKRRKHWLAELFD